MRDFAKLSTFEVTVGGVAFTLRRRTAHIMASIYADATALLGQIAGHNSKAPTEGTAEAVAESFKRTIDTLDRALPLIVVEIDGDPVDDGFDFAQLAAFAEPLFVAFLQSGLDVDPSPES